MEWNEWYLIQIFAVVLPWTFKKYMWNCGQYMPVIRFPIYSTRYVMTLCDLTSSKSVCWTECEKHSWFYDFQRRKLWELPRSGGEDQQHFYITQEEFSFPLISQQNVTTGKRQFPGENGGIAVTAAQCVKRFGTLRRYHKS